MVNLPEVPRRIALTEAPTDKFGGAQIASAYGGLAEGLNKLGDGLNDVAIRAAEDAGRNAVSIGEDGKPQVTQAPLIGGPAADAYQRTASFNAMTQADAAADRALLDLRDAHKDDPQGFLTAAKAFQQQHIENWSSAGPAVRDSLRKAMETRTTGIYSGLLSEFQTRSIGNAKASIDARLQTYGDDLETLYRRGGGTDAAGDMTPQAKDLWDNIHSLYSEKISNPLYKYPSEVAFKELDGLTTRVQGAAVLEKMENVYQQQGAQAATQFLRGSLRDLDGKVKQLDKIEAAGRSWIRATEALYKGDRDNISRDWSAAKGQAGTLPAEVLHDMEARALEVGNHRVALDIATTRSALDTVNYIRTLPPTDRANIAATGVIPPGKSAVDPIITAAAQKYGVDPNTAIRFAHIESGRDPSQVTGSYKGLFQLSDSEFKKYGGGDIMKAEDNADAAMKKIAAESGRFKQQFGRDPQPWELYLVHQQGEGGFAAHSANPTGPAWQNMASTGEGQQKGEKWAKAAIWGNLPDSEKKRFGSVENVTSQDFMNIWRARAGGLVSSGNLTDSREGIVALGMVKKDLAKDLNDRISLMGEKVKRGQFPDQNDIAEVGSMAGVVGLPHQRRQVAEFAAMAEYGAKFQELSAPQRDAVISGWDEKLRAGGSDAEGKLVDALRSSDKAIDSAYKTDRFGAFYRFGSSHPLGKATPSMDFADPAQMSVVKDIRLRQDNVIQQEQGIGAGSIFRPSEAANFGGALASADGKGTASLFKFLTDLPPDTLSATIADEKVKEAITGAARSSDTAKYTAAMIGLDSIQARDQYRFKQVFGNDVEHALADWQSNDRYLDPKALAEERRRRLDPATARAMTHLKEEGTKDAYKIKADDWVKKFDQSWLPGFLGGNVPVASDDDITRAALVGDAANIYGRRFAVTQDKSRAEEQTVKMLGAQWKRSEVNGGKLMRDAPELLYPEVGGDHGWMGMQLKADLEQRMGVKQSQFSFNPIVAPLAAGNPAALLSGLQRPRNFDYELVADDKTHAEGSSFDRSQPVSDTNKAPTYKVLVRDNRKTSPQWDFVYADSGVPLRYQFDPTNPRSTEESKFRTGRSRNESFLAAHDTEAARADRAALPTPPPAEFRNRSEAR